MKKDKYIVWEVEDLPELTKQELDVLNSISERMATEKQVKGKDTNPNYLVVKTSAAYAGVVKDLMRQHGDWD
ncbi:hypothetical protein Grass_168 [Bacillus phage Grass]|uniref:Uncharacterized protein n=1 Tax=Bacillus phage Grass TaxID=1406785 RepID=U5PY80_BPGRA|nr:hypothetical protein Grass_168 [Bacillus phage Grass]AGY47433.1 hypothetical protein Grass_168 [Bacillus phage Grass]